MQIWKSLLPSSCCDFSFLANPKSDPAVWTVPLRRAWGNRSQTDTFQVKPFLFAIRILAANHNAKAHAVAKTIPWFVRINDIAFIIHLVPDFSNILLFVFLLLLWSCFLTRCRTSLAHTDSRRTLATRLHRTRRRTLGASARWTGWWDFGCWSIMYCAGSTWSLFDYMGWF